METKMKLKQILEESPVIASVNSEEDIRLCLKSECKIVFVIHSTLTNVTSMVRMIRESGKIAIVHVDLVAGLSSKDVAVEFLKEQAKADGIISTKPQLVKRAQDLGMYGILRVFVVDSATIETIKKIVKALKPDAIELMPGIIPRIFSEIREFIPMGMIVGGLIREKSDVITAFGAGADAVSATNQKIWFM